MGRGRPAHHVFLTDADRGLLEALVRQKTSSQRDVLRANIALMAHRGNSTLAIAAASGQGLAPQPGSRVPREGQRHLRAIPQGA